MLIAYSLKSKVAQFVLFFIDQENVLTDILHIVASMSIYFLIGRIKAVQYRNKWLATKFAQIIILG